MGVARCMVLNLEQVLFHRRDTEKFLFDYKMLIQ